MMASEAAAKIQELIAQHGDRPLGFPDLEFGCFAPVGAIEPREAVVGPASSHFTDDASLSPRFFAIS